MAVNPNCDSGARAPEAHRIGRRGLLGWISSASLFGAAVLGALSTCAFLRPRVSSGPPPRFRIGKPDGFPPGARPVLDARRICVVRARDGLAAISTTCTHLGCSVVPDETGFACACHGSQFDQDGHVVSGPAPRPLQWYRLSLAPDGEIEVDQDAEVNPGSYLAL